MVSRPANSGRPHILFINPWIHDFAAYDVWAKPYGLLSLAALLRAHGLPVSYIDCLDRFHPKAPASNPNARNGRGPYRKQVIPPPKGLERIGRRFSRYGIDPEWFRQDLLDLDRPDLILVTSLMTYWYPGVRESIAVIKEIYPDVPVVLGGIYARLCGDHASRYSGADEVVGDRGGSLFDIVYRYTGYRVASTVNLEDLDAWPYPAFDLQHRIGYVPVLTTRGCPFCCAYCASRYLEPHVTRRSPESVIVEVDYWHKTHGVIDFAFYDDALLVDADHHASPLLEGIIEKGMPLNFHTPNALHIQSITHRVAHLMKHAGFHTIRLGLETTVFETRFGLDRKVTEKEFFQAVGHLKAAGFDAGQVGAYLLVGLPNQSVAAVESSIKVVKTAGITPVLAYYTPIPNTALWEDAVAASRYDLAQEPAFTNNAIFPCQRKAFSWPELTRLKDLIKA